MKIIAKKNRELALINARNTQNENKAETIELIVPEEYENYNKKIVFITDDGTVWDIITNNEYKITNAITKYKQVDFYIWLTKEVDGESIDFRTKTKTLNFYHNEDASDEITDEEIHGVNTVVNLLEEEIEKVENLNIEATKIGDTTTVTITKKDGTTESVDITDGQNGQDGKDGEDGKDAKINGKNSIEIEAGNNITIDNTETGIRINSTNDGGTTDYTDLENKPKINNVELSGNKSLNDLGIQPKGNYIEDNNYVHTDNNFNNTYKNKLEGLENYDDTEIKADISDIQEEQVEQNTEIEKLQTENARLKATLPTTTGEGQDITLDKTAELEFKKPPLPRGNSEQNGEPSPDNEVPITNVTGDVEVKVQNKNIAHDITYVSQTNQYYYLVLVSYTAKKDKIYTISFDTENTGISCYLNLVDASKLQKITSSTNFTMDGQKHSFVVKALEDVEVSNISLVARAQATSTTGSGYLSSFQIEEGSTASPYTPHKQQTFTFPLGNEKLMLGDYLADDGIHHVRGQVVLDGTEGWQQNSTYLNVYLLDGFLKDALIVEPRQMLSDYFGYGGLITQGSSTVQIGKFYQWKTLPQRLILGYNSTSLNEFKTWLSTHNTTVEYELKKEIIVPYTSAQQEVYNQIKQAISYEEQTNISSNQNALFSVEAYQSTKLVLKEMATAIVALGGV